MRFIRSLLRPLLAWVFVHGGIDVLRKPGPRAEKAEGTVEALSQRIPAIPADPVVAVKVNAIVQVGAGTLLATGRFPRLSAAVLAASLVPTTVAGHPFWEEDDPQKRAMQRTHFDKNMAMLGGLLLVATEPRNAA